VKHLPALLALTFVAAACDGDEPDKGRMSDAGDRSPSVDGGEPAALIGPPYNECRVDSDCAWGEIPHEILKKSDCICLYGCPYLALAESTVSRRTAQYEKLCDPREDRNGDPCGIDDCAMPPQVVCQEGVCAPVAGAGAPWR
jgi:hypothetical protein